MHKCQFLHNGSYKNGNILNTISLAPSLLPVSPRWLSVCVYCFSLVSFTHTTLADKKAGFEETAEEHESKCMNVLKEVLETLAVHSASIARKFLSSALWDIGLYNILNATL